MKSLQTFQTLSKIGKILSKISFICCLIGAIGCAAGVASLPFAGKSLTIGGTSVYGLFASDAGIDVNSLYPVMIGAMILCIGQAVVSKFAEKYFARELVAGTPFTEAGAKEMMRLGILTIAVPIGAVIVAEIVTGILAGFIEGMGTFEPEIDGCVGIGVMFIVMSVLCRYGAELSQKDETQESEDSLQ